MRKVIFSVATVAALLVGSATAFADGPASQQPNSGMPSSSQSSQTQVTIQNSQFMPASLTVWQDTTVTWVNQDTMGHTVTSDGTTGSAQFNSGTLPPGQRYSYTFSQTGTYTYHCSIHPQMTGSVTVMSQLPQPAPTKANQPAASAQANASATVNTYNCSSSGYAAQKAPPTTAAPTNNSSFPNYSLPATTVPSSYVKTAATTVETPEALPNTGPTGTVFFAAAAMALGTGGYYIYLLRRKKYS